MVVDTSHRPYRLTSEFIVDPPGRQWRGENGLVYLVTRDKDATLKPIEPKREIGRILPEKLYRSLTCKEASILFALPASFLEKFDLFPEIGELPEWLTEVRFRFQYIEGSYTIELEPEFDLEENTWIIESIDLGLSQGKLDWIDKRSISRGEISPSPPEGKKILDVGLNEIIKKFISDFNEKDWDSIKQYTPMFKDPEKMSELKKKGKKYGELLSQFPTIGPIPAPAVCVFVELEGELEDERIGIEVEFEWEENNTLIIDVISVNY